MIRGPRREPAEDILAGLPVRPLKRAEYEKLVELGAFDDERVELLYGRIVEMPSQGPLHDGTIDIVSELLRDRLAGRARVRAKPRSSVPTPHRSRTSPSFRRATTAIGTRTRPTS